MTDTSKATMNIDTVERQREYVKMQKRKGNGLGLVFADAFLRGMRDIGYKSPAWALAEEIDNSFQAAAQTVSIRFGFDKSNKTQSKPDMIALIDDGNGMIPDMISYAVRWGGTDREGDRTGFGRYGYGLPSSLVSLATQYTIYSKTRDGDWHAVSVDLSQLADAASDLKKTEELLSPRSAKLPSWVITGEDKIDLRNAKSGTVIVVEDLDRLHRLGGWIKVESLKSKLIEQFGVIYRHWIPEKRIFVDGGEVQAVDPLFLMEHGRFYDESPVRALKVEARSFEVETPSGKTGRISIRASHLPANFQLVNPADDPQGGAKNKRLKIMSDYNGLLICRELRHIDHLSPRWTRFQNYDRNVKIEINFDPELDEYFGITTSKQQITIDDEMWEKLQHSGKAGGALMDLVKDLREKFETSKIELAARSENQVATGEQHRPSAVAMQESEKFDQLPSIPTIEQQEEAARNLDHVATQRALVTKKSKEEVLPELLQQTSTFRFDIEFAAIPEGPFYRPQRLGEQKRVILNTDHPFYTKIYSGSGADVQGSLEVLLFVLAERELDSKGDCETFYKAERQKWSERLRHALNRLGPDSSMADKASAVAEMMHMAAETEAQQN
jgi:hypothetical protein